MGPGPGAPRPSVPAGPRPVTTTDALKLVALVLVFIDHHGYFFDPGNPWWRLAGRPAAPVFFFLVGFSRTRHVPFSWLAFGLALTAINAAKAESLAETMANILLNFALLRALVLPLAERWTSARPWTAALLAALCLVLLRVSDGPLEYGTEGWLWALSGLAHRLWLEDRTAARLAVRIGLTAVASAAYVAGESLDFGFDARQVALFATVVAAGLAPLLLGFRRQVLHPQPPALLAPAFRLCGRYSLEIYAAGLFVSHALAYAIAR